MTPNPVCLLPTGHGRFSIKGLDKYANEMGWRRDNLEQWQAKFLLASVGMDPTIMPGLFKGAQAVGRATIHGLKQPPLKSEKIAGALPEARRLIKIAKKLKSNLIKEASFMDNSQTVDALLSLNFINPDNIQKFIAKVPSLKSAISNLASLLMASRLGIKEIPEQAVSTSMNRLVEVVDGLESLRATQEG